MTTTPTRYRYETGRASWHQRRAGHFAAAVLICDHTPAEHAAFLARYRDRNEPVTWTTSPTPTTTAHP
jgi:hypothetical protein